MNAWGIESLLLDPRFKNVPPVDPDEYAERYLRLLRQRYHENPQPFLDLIDMEAIVLMCFCHPDVECCHRWIGSHVLTKIAESRGYSVIRLGEIA